MALDESSRRKAAEALAHAEATRSPIAPLSDDYPDIDVADAYAIQLLQIEAKLARGERIRGHKVGLSSRAMQQMIGVDEPDYGHLMSTMFVNEGQAIRAAELCAPLAEMEIAFVLGKPLAGPSATMADVLSATAYVCPALEIVDSLVRDWKIKIADTIADNASSARVVLGGKRTSLDGLDLRQGGVVRATR
jgi:2-keto-4-pentenoate hydratase